MVYSYNGKLCSNEQTTAKCNNREESQINKINTEKEARYKLLLTVIMYLLTVIIYIKLKNRHNKLMVITVNIVLTFG